MSRSIDAADARSVLALIVSNASFPPPTRRRGARTHPLTEPIRDELRSLQVVDGSGPTLPTFRGMEDRMLDLLMVVLTLVAFAVFVAMVAWLERV